MAARLQAPAIAMPMKPSAPGEGKRRSQPGVPGLRPVWGEWEGEAHGVLLMVARGLLNDLSNDRAGPPVSVVGDDSFRGCPNLVTRW